MLIIEQHLCDWRESGIPGLWLYFGHQHARTLTHMHTYARTHTHTYKCAHTHTTARTHARAHSPIFRHIHTSIHPRIHTHIHARVLARIHARTLCAVPCMHAQTGASYLLRVQFLEVYGESIRDLLDPAAVSGGVQVGVYVAVCVGL